MTLHHLDDSELGKQSEYCETYNPQVLFSIPRKIKRDEIGITTATLPFYGYDCWNHYEVSWLNPKGKPIVAIAEIYYDCTSPNIIESKSLKLYFNSFNNTKFESIYFLQKLIKQDLERKVSAKVIVNLIPLNLFKEEIKTTFSGISIDHLDVTCTDYVINRDYLSYTNDYVEEIIHSDLLKSNCLITNQPDWGSIQISYKGNKINHEGLLKYIVSFRSHNEFHEQCIERIFIDIMNICKPKELTIHGRYTRRGGIDINPVRSTDKNIMKSNFRLCRQ